MWSKSKGFALVLVLGTLTLLAVIFSVATTRFLSSASVLSSEKVLAEIRENNRQTLVRSLRVCPNSEPVCLEAPELLLADNTVAVRLQNVGSLIDLNTAHPDLLKRLFEFFDLDEAARTEYVNWRRTGRRFLRHDDFARVVGLANVDMEKLYQVSTVHSGKAGIYPQSAPQVVLNIASGMQSSASPSDVPNIFVSSRASVNFHVLTSRNEGQSYRFIGAVHLPTDHQDRRLLWVR